MSLLHPTQAVIDLDRLRDNLGRIRGRIPRACEILAVVKANAYGHGAVQVAHTLRDAGASHFGVAFFDEGAELRKGGIEDPILVMGGFLREQAREILSYGLTPVISNWEQAEWLAAEAKNAEAPVEVHLKIDTGMGRLGVRPESADEIFSKLSDTPALSLNGIMSHFSEEELTDTEVASEQLARFEHAIDQARRLGLPARLNHIANSTAILTFSRSWHEMVRPGIILYGYVPSGARWDGPAFQPILTLRTRITNLKRVPAGTPISYGRTFSTTRDSLIAVLPIGYADGYPRALSNRGQILVRGQRAPIVGRVCMDMTMADVTDIDGVALGDEAILIGRQGAETITADEIAGWLNTISYEVLCGIGRRVPRIYSGDGKDHDLA